MKAIAEVDVVLASPSDTEPERTAAMRVIERLNEHYCRQRGLHIALHRWEDVAPIFHKDGPQGAIDPKLKIPKVDVLIGIFWQHFGTPLKNGAPSGTVHEFEQAYHSWKAGGQPQIMFYFKTKPPRKQPNARAAEQLAQVLRFKEEFPGEGLYKDFPDTKAFEQMLEKHLDAVLGDLLSRSLGASLAAPRAARKRVALPEAAPSRHLPIGAASQVQAVIFTHFGGLNAIDVHTVSSDVQVRYEEVIKSYCLCKRVAIVYVYLDRAIGKLIASRRGFHKENGKLSVPAELLTEEQALIEWLEGLKRSARSALGIQHGTGPRFHFVGLGALLELLKALQEVDPDLIHLLHGPGGRFTYDSPKFVEAVIRLARGDSPHLAMHPVVRVDEDARANDEAISVLLDRFEKISVTKPFYLFSGTYGVSATTDHLNDHAVRTHWFVKEGTRKGDPLPPPVLGQIETFLTDISLLGATQFVPLPPMSSAGLQRSLAGNSLTSDVRSSSQVISGAGLIMSRKAVDLLPPFMNLGNLTLWVDDHLKRRLHEMLGDIAAEDPECLVEARFDQDRHPAGVTLADKARATDYFQRVLRGCLFHAIVTGPRGARTSYGELIRDIVLYSASANDERLDGSLPAGKHFREGLMKTAQDRFDLVRASWTSSEFAGTDLWKWARKLDKRQASKYCAQVTDDALAYARLAKRWHVFVRAIQRLPYLGTRWLFESVPPLPAPQAPSRHT
jgi:hypothetical protein